MDKLIAWQDFEKIEFALGTILSAKTFPEARKSAYILTIDFGEEIGLKKSSAQITDLYTPNDLVGKQILAVINFPPKQIGPIISECLVTGFYGKNGAVVLATADKPLPNGSKLG